MQKEETLKISEKTSRGFLSDFFLEVQQDGARFECLILCRFMALVILDLLP